MPSSKKKGSKQTARPTPSCAVPYCGFVELHKIAGNRLQGTYTDHFAHSEATGWTFTAGKMDATQTLLFQVLGSVSQFERAIIRERQAEGIAKAKATGKYKGRKPKLTSYQKTTRLIRRPQMPALPTLLDGLCLCVFLSWGVSVFRMETIKHPY
ncbi:recombinase family protein [uncultured Pseudodesulfovibrio sp.]|uniref:recombinase family protein n=1 Tax=uncultured Pseudodesulfovibrio sp. TaxID=2035858 RepID=UPI0029C8B0E3|nr:recombinase family protein [uncultured Pseudodesulfovibrio sp.]